MFVSVKNLLLMVEQNIEWVKEAKDFHTCSQAEYEEYLDSMYKKLDNQLLKLHKISSNTKLISSYEKKIDKVKAYKKNN